MSAFLYNFKQYGFLQINNIDENISIFIDNNEKESDFNFKLRKGEHNIILSKEGYWPWAKDINIIKKENIEITPFFVPQNSSGVLIGENDSEYYKLLSLFNKNLISTEVFEKITNSVIKTQIKAIDFYKDRTDVVLVAVNEGVYALEINEQNINQIDNSINQNLQPIYKGNDPLFVKNDNNSLYILDNNNLMMVNY